ncbi:hypothetical protein [Pontibacter beigongshangensis]|uniref:hypothetical protein n=1 Tax=Pontibacter beigongshangensis TaxID=2574733 RepID=UPI001650A8BB|nr:hypothetical protein [Pontibacter beigongshangensis]
MKTIVLLLILQVVFFGCQSPSAETELSENTFPAEPATPVAQAAATGENTEYLDWRSLRINGKYPLVTTVKNMDGLLGKPDSVNTIDWNETCSSDFRNESSKLAYYSAYLFELFDDSLDFQSVDFRKNKNVFLQSNDLKLNAATTLEEIKKRFPNAAQNMEKVNVDEVGEVETISLPPSRDYSDGQWLLMFQEGKLIRIDDWFPC